LLPATLIAIAIALAALAIALCVSCHPHCIAIALAALAITLFVACHFVTIAITRVITVPITIIPISCLPSLSPLPLLLPP
jgi:hypothetical protein